MNKVKSIVTLFSFVVLLSCKPTKRVEIESSKLLLTDSLSQIVSIDTVKMSKAVNILNISGKVTFDQENVVEVFPIFGGNVTEVNVELGDFIKKGEPLAVIKSGEVADYEKQRKEAESQLLIAKKNLQIANDMNKSGLMSDRDILIAEKDLENANAEWKKMNEVFNIYNIGNSSQYTVKSPVSGFVVQKNINREMQLRSDSNTEIFIISGLNDIWILANVYESDISKVKLGDEVQITTPAYANRTFSGKIDKVYNVLDSESKTMTVRIKLKNNEYLLKPGMFARVKVIYGLEGNLTPCIHQQSLIFDSEKYYVVVVSENKELKIQEVKIGESFGDKVPIIDGLMANELIIEKNALLVYSSLKQ